jgi:uncharacterized protein (DUF39 family)
MAQFTAVSDKDIDVQIVDYGNDYPNGISKNYGFVTYDELKSGFIQFQGKDVPTVPLSGVAKAREIADILKDWIQNNNFLLGEPQFTLPAK